MKWQRELKYGLGSTFALLRDVTVRVWAISIAAVTAATLMWLPDSATAQATAPLVPPRTSTTSVSVATCQPKLLREEVLALVKPFMELRIKQAEERLVDGGTWRGALRYEGEVDARLPSLLENRTPAGDEALAYLLTIYLGEHSGGELVCEVVRRGRRMVPLVQASQTCQPLIGLEPLPRGVRSSGLTAKYALDYLASSEPCQEE